jgi:HPt (histidine-containing phosphotransfer) domain-containing protein
VAELIDVFGDGAATELAAMVEGFATNAQAQLARARAAAVGGDCATVRAIGHALKGSSANLGAARLSETCGAIEQAAANGVPGGVPELTDQAQAELTRATEALLSQIRQPTPQ